MLRAEAGVLPRCSDGAGGSHLRLAESETIREPYEPLTSEIQALIDSEVPGGERVEFQKKPGSQPHAPTVAEGVAVPAPGPLDAELGWAFPALRGRGVLTP